MPLVKRQCTVKSLSVCEFKDIAGRLPENSCNSFVDLQSKKQQKRKTKKPRLFIEG